MQVSVRDNQEQSRYEVFDEGRLAGFADYELSGEVVSLVHTEVGDEFAGRGLAGTLVRQVLDDARARGWSVVPECPFVRGYIAKHGEYRDLVPRHDWARFELED